MKRNLFVIANLLLSLTFVFADKKDDTKKDTSIKSSTFSGLKFRSIGPAFTSGRISDFAVNPENPSEYYTAVESGNIWKTDNKGTQ